MTTAFEVDRNELSMNGLDIDGLLWYRRVECLPTDAEDQGSILCVDLRLLKTASALFSFLLQHTPPGCSVFFLSLSLFLRIWLTSTKILLSFSSSS